MKGNKKEIQTFLNGTIKYETRVRTGSIFNQASFLLSSMSPCASVLALSRCLLDGEHTEGGGELLYVSPSSQHYNCVTLTPDVALFILHWFDLLRKGAPETLFRQILSSEHKCVYQHSDRGFPPEPFGVK